MFSTGAVLFHIKIANNEVKKNHYQKSWADAASACCALGMELLSLENATEYSTISDIVDGINNIRMHV
jgi:hypothetical protein